MNINPKAKRILCFGDSYTWGYIPATKHERFNADERWTGVLQNKLGDKYEVIEEGLNSRTMFTEDLRHGKEGRNGSLYLIACLDTHDPIDIVVLMLGTNELKDGFDWDEATIRNNFEHKFVKTILERESQFKKTFPKLLLICPPKIDLSKDYAKERYSMSLPKYESLKKIFVEISLKYRLNLIESYKIISVGEDGVHIDKDNSDILANEVYINILELL